ncbi:nitrite reductase small subunit NirD [Fictibacillus fluitans]|uniref:Nitrite reductase small subunit NirD n=1 Tax=Fictibacillus fluitans TaxID=3058422 RepID=A0ABT8I015_9BACL|nr:nitrite reductase small subunit NirD [Fictibacillus sp. NE201]MDN4526313.1 nitrite reductase small subunit NirD [Fictibacillus sp. NE201]
MNRIEVAKLSKLPEKLGMSLKVGEHDIALFKLSNGKIKAVENRCPHKGGVLAQGMVSGEYVFCPMHDWKICTESGEAQGPDTGCVKTYKVEVQEEKVYLCL